MILTFYSYKGGVGRSMMLANVAQLLCEAGLKVLIVDWDLEAPGLERFFFPNNEDVKCTREHPGVMDILLEYKKRISCNRPSQEKQGEQFLPFESITPYLINVYPNKKYEYEGELNLLTAGYRSEEKTGAYEASVRTFDWQEFYQNWEGELFFEWLRRQFKNCADIVLIDSRTGISEMGGVCTYQFADIVVMLCASNDQNLEGTYAMAQHFSQKEVVKFRGGRELELLIVPARIERSEGDQLDAFKAKFLQHFEGFVPRKLIGGREAFWKLKVPYVPYYAYQEGLAVCESDKAKAEDLVQAYREIKNILSAWPELYHLSIMPLTNLPFSRNPFFTGREDTLRTLVDVFKSCRAAALSGLGGIGKTQTAVEYVYRYRSNYKAVLWVRSDSRESIMSDFVAFVILLQLPVKDIQDQNLAVESVKRWLETNTDWLLIFDNANDFALIRAFIPGGQYGHILFTTRSQATGQFATRVEIDKMNVEEAARFLLCRSKVIRVQAPFEAVPQNDYIIAKQIVMEMDGIPLALDQAGSYIERTGAGLADYFKLYMTYGLKLLKERGGVLADYPEPVATTWLLSFKKIEQANPAAAELLRFCAFLHPDAIPEELFSDGAQELGPTLQPVAADAFELNQAIGEILKYSLLWRDPKAKTLQIHRLVQAVIKDGMDVSEQREWAERTVKAVNQVFPEVEFRAWLQCERLLLQAQTCAEIVRKWNIELEEAATLLNKTGMYFTDRAQYHEAKPLYHRALAIREQTLGPDHPDVADSLNDLAWLYDNQGKYSEAEPLYRRALAIWEQTLGPDHPNVAASLNNLGVLYNNQGKYDEAEPLYRRALAIREQALGPDHPDVADSLNDFALLYDNQGKYSEAEPLYQRALAIREQVLGPDHPDVADSLNDLALLYDNQGKYSEAEPLYRRALAIREQALGPDHPGVAASLNNLGVLYNNQGKYGEAEPLYRRALAIREQALGSDHPDVADSLNDLAWLYNKQAKYGEAEPLYQRALAIREQALGADHPDVALSLNNLAELYRTQGKYVEAEPLYQRALAIFEQALGPDHPDVAHSLNNLALLYDSQGKYAEAEPRYQRALAIRKQALGPDHPDVAQSLNNLASLYRAQGQYAKAEPLIQQALAIWAEVLPPNHPNVAQSLNNLAELYRAQGQYVKAESRYQQALTILLDTLGPDHPNTIQLEKNNQAKMNEEKE